MAPAGRFVSQSPEDVGQLIALDASSAARLMRCATQPARLNLSWMDNPIPVA